MIKDDHPYNFAVIRELLRAAFTADELQRFCQDRPPFRPICDNFGPKYNLNEMIDEVVTYCETRRLFDRLITEVEKYNPDQCAYFKQQLHLSAESDEEHVPPPEQDGEPTPPAGEEEPPVSKADEEPPPAKSPAVKGVVLRVLVAAILIVVVAVPLVLFAVFREDGLPCGPRINPTSPQATMDTDLPSISATAEADTPTPPITPSGTATLSPTPTAVPSATAGPSVTPRLPTNTGSSSSALTPTITITVHTVAPTQPPSPTPTKISTATPTDTPSPTPTATPTPKPPPPPSSTPKPPPPAPTATDTPRIPPPP